MGIIDYNNLVKPMIRNSNYRVWFREWVVGENSWKQNSESTFEVTLKKAPAIDRKLLKVRGNSKKGGTADLNVMKVRPCWFFNGDFYIFRGIQIKKRRTKQC